MKARCETASRQGRRRCPRCGAGSPSVERLTVAALTRIVVPIDQRFWLCRNPACGLAYFGEDGTLIPASAMNVSRGFKTRTPEALVCYCFLHCRGDIESELAANGETTIPERIAKQVREGNCACEVRNPTGRCCLGEIQEAIREIGSEIDALAGAAGT